MLGMNDVDRGAYGKGKSREQALNRSTPPARTAMSSARCLETEL